MLSAGSLNIHKQEKRRGQVRRGYLKYAYKTTPEKIEEMKLRQRGLCAICQNPLEGNRPSIDHIAGTTTIRGILCNSCNLVIGHAHEDPTVLRLAAEYLEKFR